LISIDDKARKKIEYLKKLLADAKDHLPIAVAIGVNSTAKKARNEAAKKIRKELGTRVPLKVVRSAVRAKATATKDHLNAIIALEQGRPISLRYFSPTQSKRKGVSVRLNRQVKGEKGRTYIPNAFLAKRIGNKVFVRAGKSRLPIVEQFGPSPGDFIEALGLKESTVDLVKRELKKRIQRKIKDVSYWNKMINSVGNQ